MNNTPHDSCDDLYECTPRFIELVKENPIIYETNYSLKYGVMRTNEHTIRKSIWEAIGKEVNHTPEQCKKRWKNLRDSYMRMKKIGRNSQYTHLLSFLDEKVVPRKRKRSDTKTSNKNKPSDTKTSTKTNDQTLITLDMIKSLVKEKSDNDDDDDALIDATTDVLSSMFNKGLEETINKFTEPTCSARSFTSPLPEEYPKQVDAEVEDRTDECSSILISNVVSLDTSAINNATIDLKEKNTSKRKLHDSNYMTTSKTPKTELADPNKQQLDISDFFREMGEYVTTRFPYKKQMELRLKVLSLITEAELELLYEDV